MHRTGRIASINVSENMLGRVVNPLGKPLDGLKDIEGPFFEMPLERKAPGVVFREPVHQPLQTGLRAIDATVTVRQVRPPLPSIPSSTSVRIMRQVILSIAYMLLWARRVQQWQPS